MSAKGREHGRGGGGGGGGEQRGVGRVPGRQLTVGPFGPLSAAASIFLSASRGWHRARAESLATDTIDHAIFIPVLCRGLYYHSDQLNHQPFPPPPSQTNPPNTFLPNMSSARGRPAARSGNIAYCRMYSWQTQHKKQQRPQGWKGWSFIGNDILEFYFKRGILDKVCVRNTGEMDNGGTSFEHLAMFTVTSTLDGEMGNTDRETKAWKNTDIYIERALAEPFVYGFASERVARRVELTPGCRHIQALSWRTNWLAESCETKVYNLERAHRLILSMLVLVNSWPLLGK